MGGEGVRREMEGRSRRRSTSDRWSENEQGLTVPHCCGARMLSKEGPSTTRESRRATERIGG